MFLERRIEFPEFHDIINGRPEDRQLLSIDRKLDERMEWSIEFESRPVHHFFFNIQFLRCLSSSETKY
jgi:hypothetical protein